MIMGCSGSDIYDEFIGQWIERVVVIFSWKRRLKVLRSYGEVVFEQNQASTTVFFKGRGIKKTVIDLNPKHAITFLYPIVMKEIKNQLFVEQLNEEK